MMITNKSKRKLTFPKYDFTIDAGEIKEVSEKVRLELLNNIFIEDVVITKEQPSVLQGRKYSKGKLTKIK